MGASLLADGQICQVDVHSTSASNVELNFPESSSSEIGNNSGSDECHDGCLTQDNLANEQYLGGGFSVSEDEVSIGK